MKTVSKRWAWVTAGLLVVGASAWGTDADFCAYQALPKNAEVEKIVWRLKTTHLLPGQGIDASRFARTVAWREKELKDWVKEFEETILVEQATPVMEGWTEPNVAMQQVRSPDYDKGIIGKWRIKGVGSSGKMRMTLLLPVSGHDGAANARKWAKTDTYSLYYYDPTTADSDIYSGSRASAVLAKDVKSLGVVTLHEIEVQLVKGKRVRITYDRSGSAGVGGFAPGRVMEFEWDGT